MYKIKGNPTTIESLRNLFESGGTHIFERNSLPSPHDITSLISLFFEQLPEPFLPISHVRGSFGVFTVEKCQEVISKLNPCNKETLFLLLKHIRLVLSYSKKNNTTKDIILKFLFPQDASYVIVSNFLDHYEKIFREKNDIEDKLDIIRQEFQKHQNSSVKDLKKLLDDSWRRKTVTKEDSDSKIEFGSDSVHSPVVSEVEGSTYTGSFHFQKDSPVTEELGSSLDELPDRFLSENALENIKFSGLVDKNIETESLLTSNETTPNLLTPRDTEDHEENFSPIVFKNFVKPGSDKMRKEELKITPKKLSLDREINEKESDKLLSYLEKLKLNQIQKDEQEITVVEKRTSFYHSPRIRRNLREIKPEEEEETIYVQDSPKFQSNYSPKDSPSKKDNRLQLKKDLPNFEGNPNSKLEVPIVRKGSLPTINMIPEKKIESPKSKESPRLTLNVEYPKYEGNPISEAPKKRNFEKYQMDEPQMEVGSPKRPPSPIKLQVRVPVIDMSKLSQDGNVKVSNPVIFKIPEKEPPFYNSPPLQKSEDSSKMKNPFDPPKVTSPEPDKKKVTSPVKYDPVDPEFKLPISPQKVTSPEPEKKKVSSPEKNATSPEPEKKTEFEKYQNLLGSESPRPNKRVNSPVTIQMKLPNSGESPKINKRSSSPVTIQIKLPEVKFNIPPPKPVEQVDAPKSEFEKYQVHLSESPKVEKRTSSPVTINLKVPNQPPKLNMNPKPISDSTNGNTIQKPIPQFKIIPKEEQNIQAPKPISFKVIEPPKNQQNAVSKEASDSKMKQNFETFEPPKVNQGYFINITKEDPSKKMNVPKQGFSLNIPKLEIKKEK